MTREDAAKLVGMLVAAFPRQELPKPTVKLYIEHLLPLSVETTTAAVRELIDTSTFFPAFAEIRRAEARQRDLHVLTAEEAWAEVKRCVRKIGSYGRFPKGDPILAEAVRLFDWQALCRAEHHEEIANRAHFYRIYDSVLQRHHDGYLDATRPLIGNAAEEPYETLEESTPRQLETTERTVLSEILGRVAKEKVGAKPETPK